jgi:hypothetical protein
MERARLAAHCTAFLASWKRLRQGPEVRNKASVHCNFRPQKKKMRGVGRYSSYFRQSLHFNFSPEEADSRVVSGCVSEACSCAANLAGEVWNQASFGIFT